MGKLSVCLSVAAFVLDDIIAEPDSCQTPHPSLQISFLQLIYHSVTMGGIKSETFWTIHNHYHTHMIIIITTPLLLSISNHTHQMWSKECR
jgi:hypothetical protein